MNWMLRGYVGRSEEMLGTNNLLGIAPFRITLDPGNVMTYVPLAPQPHV
jgi:hypothetical protein